jgi:hypothetical protein
MARACGRPFVAARAEDSGWGQGRAALYTREMSSPRSTGPYATCEHPTGNRVRFTTLRQKCD